MFEAGDRSYKEFCAEVDPLAVRRREALAKTEQFDEDIKELHLFAEKLTRLPSLSQGTSPLVRVAQYRGEDYLYVGFELVEDDPTTAEESATDYLVAKVFIGMEISYEEQDRQQLLYDAGLEPSVPIVGKNTNGAPIAGVYAGAEERIPSQLDDDFDDISDENLINSIEAASNTVGRIINALKNPALNPNGEETVKLVKDFMLGSDGQAQDKLYNAFG